MNTKTFYCIVLLVQQLHGKIWLQADGRSNTYALINSTFGGNALELPDCAHRSFGPHITQQMDSEMNRTVFVFHVHITPDNDRCTKNDRQRVEIKPPKGSSKQLKGFEGETVSMSWNFRIDINFQVTPNFCTVHQIKLNGGNDSLPIVAINLRSRGRNRQMEVIFNGRTNRQMVWKSENLTKFLGIWIHAKEELSYGKIGNYTLILSRWDTEEQLLSVVKNAVDLWRDGAEYARPKWGIYRSLANIDGLRDEEIYFDSFCVGSGTSDKCV